MKASINRNTDVAGFVPPSLADGETFLNRADGLLYWRDAAGVVQASPLPRAGALQTYTPIVMARTNSLASASGVDGRYFTVGRMCFFTGTAVITTNGAGTGGVRMTLPKMAANAGSWIANGRDDGHYGKQLQGIVFGGFALMEILWNDGGYPGVDGAALKMSGFFEMS